MAKYNLPQFSTSPTPASQQQPIIKLPNYAEIYARSFAAGQQSMTEAFRPIRNEIEKIQLRKEKDRLEKKADEERLLRKEENIAKDASSYQKLIFDKITKDGAGDFEGEIENMLMKNVDGFAANERAYKIEQSISAEDYNKMRAFYYKEINDMKISSEALKASLDFDAQNSEKYSRYNNPEFPGLIESLKQGEARLGRTKTGDLAIIYDDALDKEASFLVKDLKNLRAEDNINLKLDFSDKSNIGHQSHNQLEKELNEYGIVNPTVILYKNADSNEKIVTQTTVAKFTADQKEQAIKYITSESPTMRNLMGSGTGVGGKYYLDNMLYADGLGETGADVKVNTLAKKYFKSKGIVPSAEEFEKVENLLETYNDELILDNPLQNEIKTFQDEQIKLDYAENLWNNRFATKEKEAQPTKVIDTSITNQDQINSQKKLYADSLDLAIDTSNKIQEIALKGSNEKNLMRYTDNIKDELNNFLGLDATQSVQYDGTQQLGRDGTEDKQEAVYKLPEAIFGKNKTIEIDANTTSQDLWAFRNKRFGDWTSTADIRIDDLIQGRDAYRLNKQSDNAQYYADTITKFGGALEERKTSDSTPATTTEIKGREYPENIMNASNEPIVYNKETDGSKGDFTRAIYAKYNMNDGDKRKYNNKYGDEFTEKNLLKYQFDKTGREKYNTDLANTKNEMQSKVTLLQDYYNNSQEVADVNNYKVDEVKKILKKIGKPWKGQDSFTKKDLALVNYIKAGNKFENLEQDLALINENLKINRDYE
tara:strand:- start:3353 stop:5650 length:2298 start_codon:yes stop_codon:yes gene_type:complete